jgi:hypothetical protein
MSVRPLSDLHRHAAKGVEADYAFPIDQAPPQVLEGCSQCGRIRRLVLPQQLSPDLQSIKQRTLRILPSQRVHFESANIVERCRQIAVVCAMILFSEPSINGLA